MAVPLTDPWFEAELYGRCNETGGYWRTGSDRLEGAQGLILWCPCGHGRPEYPVEGARPHAVMIPFANPVGAPSAPPSHGPTSRDGGRPRWTVSGTCLADLTLSPSVDVGTPSCWHGWICNGAVGP